MQLSLNSCTIRPWRLDDAESLANHANNRKVRLALRDLFPHPYSVNDAQEFSKKTLTEQPVTNFCIEVDDVGYGLGEKFWGRGIMSEAIAPFIDFCFDNFPLHRIYAEPFANNPASARVLEKAGFAFEGRLKNNVIKDGTLLDSLLYAKTK